MNTSKTTTGAFSPYSIARMLWKRKVLVLITWVAFSAATTVVVQRLPAVYMADTLILVDSQKIPEKYVASTVSTDLQDRLMTINQQILSSTRLQKIIDDFGLYADLKKTQVQEEILDKMRGDITVKIEASGTNNRPGAFRIGYQGENPSLVAQVANRIANLYIEENLKTREVQAEGTTEFIGSQLKDAKKTLDDLEAALSKYKVAHNGELPQQEGELGAALARLQTQLEAGRDAANRAEQSKVMLSTNLATLENTLTMMKNAASAAAVPAPGTTGAMAGVGPPISPRAPTDSERKMQALESQLAGLRARYGDLHPDVKRVQAEIAQVQAETAQVEPHAIKADTAAAHPNDEPTPPVPPMPAVKTSVPPAPTVVPTIQTTQQLANLRSQIELADKELEFRKKEQVQLIESMNQLQRRMNNLPVREQEMAQLMRDYEMSKVNYRSLLDKKISAEMASDMEHRQKSERFTVLDPARVPEKPAKPPRALFEAMGCLAALALGLLLGFALEFQRDLFLGEWELAPNIPILARVPYIDSFGSIARGRTPMLRRVVIASSAVLILGAAGWAAYYIATHRS